METAAHIDALEREGALLAAAAERAGPAALIPACAPWQVADLLRHLAYVHRWAAGYASGSRPRGSGRASEPEILASGPPDGELVAWYRDAHRDLVATLRTADPAAAYGAFLPAPSPLAFWARRQAHETAVHRADAQHAAGTVPRFGRQFAADGIDELLLGFAVRAKQPLSPGSQRALAVRATDTGDGWLVSIGPGGIGDVQRGSGPADCVAEGPACGLYLLLWNRLPAAAAGVTVRGDERLLRLWREHMRVTWG
jgi:uncharacterized protein (TIGR03083 family)